MKKTIIVVVGVLMTVLLGCCSVVGVESPIDKGVIECRDFDYILFEGEEQVNLSYISSDLYESALLMEFTNFTDNTTTYKFTSLEILIGSDFVADVKDFYYQDMNTGQIYVVSIDYSAVEVPPSQLELDYQQLSSDYENLISDYEELVLTTTELQSNLSSIETELSNYTNITGIPLENVTRALVSSYFDLIDLLNQTKEKLNSTEIELSETLIKHLNLQNNHTALILAFNDLNESYNELNEIYSITYNDLKEANAELLEYENFTNHLNSYDIEGFHFQEHYYRPIRYYQNKISDLESGLGIVPIYIVVAVVLTLIIFIVIVKFGSGKKLQSDISEIHESVDRLIQLHMG